ncbi:sugar ABC transporter substrate-binding protein [Herbiconiux sp. A18JL235]|uniref:Sugar ABC transporter substrate-binding protein n=1 Tax=Herbiconiux sp. A18JL235 TaxID=3152363 RepID=A0AB39BHP9_9MICO
MALGRRNRGRLLAAIGATIAGTALLAGCSGATPSAPDPDEVSGSITVWSWETTVEDTVKMFEEEYPNIDVTLVHQGDGNTLYQQIQTAFEAGSGAPDVTMVEFDMIPQWALSKDITSLSALGADEIAGDFTDATIGLATIDGTLYGIPSDAGPMALAYRTDLFEQAGIAVPTTWDEFAKAAEAYKAAYPDSYIANSPFADTNTQQMLWQASVFPIHIDGDTIGIDYDSQEAVDVVSFWNDLVQRDLVSSIPVYSPDWNKAIAEDTIGSMLAAAWSEQLTAPAAEGTNAGKWTVAPLPTWKAGTPASALWGGSAYAVTEQSANKQAAALFAEFAGHDERISKLPNAGFPVLKQYAENDEFLATPVDFYGGQASKAVFAEAMTTVPDGWEWSPFSSTVMSAFNEKLGDMTKGKLTPEEAMAEIQSTVTDFATDQGFTVSE